MSVASSNSFALLTGVENEQQLLANASKQAKKAQPKTTTTTPVPAPSERARPSERTIKSGYPSRGGHRRVAGRDAETPAFPERVKEHSRPVHQGGQRGRGAFRGRGRQFDRHSGTGLVDSEKKEKQGWLGDEKALVEDDAKAAKEAKKDLEEGGAATAAAEEEPEEAVKTFEDYLKERETSALEGERSLRKANEGAVDKNQLKGAVPLKREEVDFFAPVIGQKSRKQRERKEKAFVDIEQRFEDQPRRGAFRGGRGGHRGDRRGNGSGRQNRVNINDERAFPSL
ncbi:hypothetical protein J3B02_001990 [Coemansia erecta]|uniref:Hyaluronan/mRNA-binding protein domain-containing protein n=1 Tax=Coemansia asiatica TaxID=1052880 RepID=A0A9W7XQH0_9FUNG|nr:hypothetical protein LPJ64_001137 [Coemansia asiatica]KAJ2855769.1 hypothetical protein J3B02_001990 [Coemansia erecta]KAJ2886813.1 hypothetical protein FB639_001501 [Coemansia asiatica]